MPQPPDTDSPDTSTTTARPPITAPDQPREENIEKSFDRILEQGIPRLQRAWPDVLATGAVAGFEVAFGVLALLYVDNQTHNPLLGGLAFSIGFMALFLGHSELFTEGFLVPVTVVAAGEARLRDLAKLWSGTLVANLAGGWVMAWIINDAFPSLHSEAISTADHYIQAGINGQSFCLAVLAGAAITMLTRMHQGTESDGARLAASVAIAFLLAGVRLFHSVLDSLLAFIALDTGRAPFGYLDWLGFFVWVVLGNVVGGLALTTLLRLLRSRARLGDHRNASEHAVLGQ
jgi:formate/nitrite transporter FocA (FNT family)